MLQSAAPACEVVRNHVFVEDSPAYSSAGVTTGIDLILHASTPSAARRWRPRWRKPW